MVVFPGADAACAALTRSFSAAVDEAARISPDVGHATEPWTFVLDRDGTIVERFDNVATDDELAAAAQRQVG